MVLFSAAGLVQPSRSFLAAAACGIQPTHRKEDCGSALKQRQTLTQMPQSVPNLPTSGFALEVDGRLKTHFATQEGARQGAEELKRRFPMLQVRIYDAAAKARLDLPLA